MINKLNTSINRFIIAQTISLFGSSLVQYSIIWHITLSTSSGKMLAIATLCGFVPQIMVALFGGVIIDRYNRKKIVMLTDTLIAVCTALIVIAFFLGYRFTILLFAALVLRSAGAGIQTPAVNALIHQIVSKDKLMQTNGMYSTINSATNFIAPAVSGAILSFASFEAALLIDVVTAILGVGITATVRIRHYQQQSSGDGTNTLIKEIKAGFNYLKDNQAIKSLLIFQFVILFLISPSAFLMPLLVSRSFGAEMWRLAVSETGYSLGTVLGGLLITVWGGFAKRTQTIMLAGGVYGAIMIALGLAPTFIIYMIFNTFIGITSPCYSTPANVFIQENTTEHMQGRIFSLMQIASSCALPLGMTLFGIFADSLSVQLLMIFAGILVLLTTAYIWRTGKLDHN